MLVRHSAQQSWILVASVMSEPFIAFHRNKASGNTVKFSQPSLDIVLSELNLRSKSSQLRVLV